MAESGLYYSLNLLGPFRLVAPSGSRIEIPSRKGMALIAMLAMAKGGERTRNFLRVKLWGSRQEPQAHSSMRRELSNLRLKMNETSCPLLICEHDRVRLDMGQLRVDVLTSDRRDIAAGEFLEGIDLPGESEFEDWLREQRLALEKQIATASTPASDFVSTRSDEGNRTTLPNRIVDVSQPAPGFGGRPAIAVMSFKNLTGDRNNDYLSEGIAEELIDRLSRLRWLPVIARSSTFSANLESTEQRDIGQTLGAKYLLEGRLRPAGGNFLVSLSLTEPETGYVLWSRRVQLSQPDLPAAMEQFVSDIVAMLDSCIDHAEQAQAHAKPQSDLNVSDLIWRGRWHLNKITREDSRIAQRLFEQALSLDQNSPEALIQTTFCMGWSLWAERKSEPDILEMRRLAQRAIVADPCDGRGHMLAGIAELWLRRHQRAEVLLKHAIAINPSLALAHAQLGSCKKLMGCPAEAIDPLRTALRLSPNDMHLFYAMGELAAAHCMLGQWSEAIVHADLALTLRTAYWYAYVVKINALVRSGNLDTAQSAYHELVTAKRGFTRDYITWLPFADSRWNGFFIEGLAAALEMRPVRVGTGTFASVQANSERSRNK